MDNCKEVVHSLREWAPLTEVLDLIPARVQKGIFPSDLSITCIDVIPEYIALGTDAGIVFWYNRINTEIQKLRIEVTSPISCIRIVSSVEYMVAAGSVNGQVNVFQIQKKLPSEINIVAPLTKIKPIQRYTIRDLHKTILRCTEWSKNGMKLYSGDKNGVIVLTEFDYQKYLSKSYEILNESYDIVQLSVYQSFLLVSTLYRSIICERGEKERWRISEIGNIDRNIMGEFGGTFIHEEKFKSPKIIACRPQQQFWLANTDGIVERIYDFHQNSLNNNRIMWEIPILNPSRFNGKLTYNFSVVLIYREKFIVTYDDTILYILNLADLKIEAIAKGFRKIMNVIVCGNEIFVLEGARTIIRLAPIPEPHNKKTKVIFSPLHPPPIPLMGTLEQPIEYIAEEEIILSAEECFELPPIEFLQFDIPIATVLDSPRTEQAKLEVEKNRRIDVLNKISELDFEDSIIYHTGKKLSKKGLTGSGKKKRKQPNNESKTEDQSTVEQFQQLSINNTIINETGIESVVPKSPEITNHAYSMDASFYNGSIIITDPQSPDTVQRNFELKERAALTEKFNLESSLKLFETPADDLRRSQIKNEIQQPNLDLSICQARDYPISIKTTKGSDAQVQTTPRKKPYFNDDPQSYEENDNNPSLNFYYNNDTHLDNNQQTSDYNNSQDIDDRMLIESTASHHKNEINGIYTNIQKHNAENSDKIDYCSRNGKSMLFKSCRPLDNISSTIPTTSKIRNNKTCKIVTYDIDNLPTRNYMNSENISINDPESSPQSYTSSEWEYVEDNKN